MPEKYLIKNGNVINEGQTKPIDILIEDERIVKIDTHITDAFAQVVDVEGSYVIAGVIDDQVHFREPGLTHKASIDTESRAAIAGGITSFIEQPNTVPQSTTIELLEKKFDIAKKKAYANYSFMLGGTNTNIEELKRLDKNSCAGIKLFLGSSTGNMLVDDPKTIEAIFSNVDILIAAHCEDEATIAENTREHIARYGENIPFECHPKIRSQSACYISSSNAIALAKKTNARLHVFHVSTAKELPLFSNNIPLIKKRITSEACIHHLWFCDEDYTEKGAFIKWNPAIKTTQDRDALRKAVIDGTIDIIATDHAPHTLEEKLQPYVKSPSGGPLVQHALTAMFELCHQGIFTKEILVEKMCHAPAQLFQIKDRGFLREGYYADLVVINPNSSWKVNKENILYKCRWSPFEGFGFHSQITHTFVNGNLAYQNGTISRQRFAKRLTFNR